MRSLALLLLLANISFLIWQLSMLPWLPWQPSQFGPVLPLPSPPASHLPRLILASEREAVSAVTPASHLKPQPSVEKPKNGVKPAILATVETPNSKKEEVATNVTEHSVPKAVVVAEKPVITAESPSTNLPEKKVAADTTQPVDVVSSDSQQVVESMTSVPAADLTALANTKASVVVDKLSVPEKSDKPVAAEKSDKAVESNKAASHDEKSAPAKTPKPETKAAATPVKMMCLRVGPYNQAEVAKEVADSLNQKYAGSTKIQQHEGGKNVLQTRVYLPFESKGAAQQAQQRLVQLGIKEYTLLPDNTISLGVYRDPVNAEQRLAGIKDKGFTNVKMEKQYKNGTQQWLSVKIPLDQNEWLNGFKKNFKGAIVETVACEKLP